MKNYFRITAYNPKEDICGIFDSYGKYDAKWRFSSDLVCKGFKIVAVGSIDKFEFGSLLPAEKNSEQIMLRACGQGRPIVDGKTITVNGKHYNII